MNYSVKKPYIKAGPEKRRKYPFDQIEEGGYLDPPFKWEDANRVKYAMQKWNHTHKACLHMSRYPKGTAAHPEPHVVVGWAAGEVYRPKAQRKDQSKNLKAATPIKKKPTPAQNAKKGVISRDSLI